MVFKVKFTIKSDALKIQFFTKGIGSTQGKTEELIGAMLRHFHLLKLTEKEIELDQFKKFLNLSFI
jgi:hypothetical protein